MCQYVIIIATRTYQCSFVKYNVLKHSVCAVFSKR